HSLNSGQVIFGAKGSDLSLGSVVSFETHFGESLDASLACPYTEIITSLRAPLTAVCPALRKNSATRRSSRGETHGIRLDYSEERRPHLDGALLAFFCCSSGLPGGILLKVPLVLLGYLPGRLLHSHVFCDCRLSPIFFASFVQDEPRVPIRNGLSRHHVHAERRALVGGQSPASPPPFGYGRRPALPHV